MDDIINDDPNVESVSEDIVESTSEALDVFTNLMTFSFITHPFTI